jgi:glycerol-3-phosphate dehydrogenase (NAD(P)+)
MKIAVLGAGAWGSALACHAAARHELVLWGRDPDQIRQMNATRVNARYLPDTPLPPALRLTADAAVLGEAFDLVVLAVPMAGLRGLAQRLQALPERKDWPVIWLCKGLEADTGLLPHEILAQAWPTVRAGVLSGPSFAREVAAGLPVALVVASTHDDVARATQEAFHHGAARIYRSDDLVGVEVGGALKNVMAIAAGICDGLALGNNARAALLTRGLAEIARYATALGASPQTLMGLAGMGDLVLTCTGDLSRNRAVGLQLAAGQPLEAILAQLGHVAEGVACCRAVQRRARGLDIDMPVVDAVCAVLFEQLPPREAVVRLLSREPRDELRD